MNMFSEVKMLLKRNRDMHEYVSNVVIAFLITHKRGVIPFLGKDIAQLIAQLIWESRVEINTWVY